MIKPTGWKGKKADKFWTRNTKKGVMYLCSSCGKKSLGIVWGEAEKRMMHWSTCIHADYRGHSFELKEQPQFYMGNPPLTVGKKYLVKDVDGSNFVIDDDEGNPCSIGNCRFNLSDLTSF